LAPKNGSPAKKPAHTLPRCAAIESEIARKNNVCGDLVTDFGLEQPASATWVSSVGETPAQQFLEVVFFSRNRRKGRPVSGSASGLSSRIAEGLVGTRANGAVPEREDFVNRAACGEEAGLPRRCQSIVRSNPGEGASGESPCAKSSLTSSRPNPLWIERVAPQRHIGAVAQGHPSLP